MDKHIDTHMDEHITVEGYDSWRCLCGNVAESDGFYPSTREGELVEPEPGVWDGVHYVCARCDRVIDQHTLVVVK